MIYSKIPPVRNNLLVLGDCHELLPFLVFCGGTFDFGKFIAPPAHFAELEKVAGRLAPPTPSPGQARPPRLDSGCRRWCLESWGTAWNAFNVQMPRIPKKRPPEANGRLFIGQSLEISFDTAIYPPLPVVREAARRFPGLAFHLNYGEAGGEGILRCVGDRVSSAVDETEAWAVRKVTSYLWEDELRDYRANPTPGHVFEALVMLDGWINGGDWTVQDYLLDGEGEG